MLVFPSSRTGRNPLVIVVEMVLAAGLVPAAQYGLSPAIIAETARPPTPGAIAPQAPWIASWQTTPAQPGNTPII